MNCHGYGSKYSTFSHVSPAIIPLSSFSFTWKAPSLAEHDQQILFKGIIQGEGIDDYYFILPKGLDLGELTEEHIKFHQDQVARAHGFPSLEAKLLSEGRVDL